MSLPGWFTDWNVSSQTPNTPVSHDTLWQTGTWVPPAPQRSYEPFLNSSWNPLISDIPKVFSPAVVSSPSPSPPSSPSVSPLAEIGESAEVGEVGEIDSLNPDLAQMVLQVTEPVEDSEDAFTEDSFVPVSGVASWSNASVQSPNAKPSDDIEQQLTKQCLYKSELCRSFEDTGKCRYGSKCQFAHGRSELRPVLRHPKYKTEVCKTFQSNGSCPYGIRCRFIHISAEEGQKTAGLSSAGEEHPSEEGNRSRRRSKRRSRQKNTSAVDKEAKSRLSFFQNLVPTQ